jgi:two-component system sensor histidine kinase KdpD
MTMALAYRPAGESAKPGVGLGLAICRAIIQAHKGTIRAAVSPDGGACIVFSLSLGTPPAMPDMDLMSASIRTMS